MKGTHGGYSDRDGNSIESTILTLLLKKRKHLFRLEFASISQPYHQTSDLTVKNIVEGYSSGSIICSMRDILLCSPFGLFMLEPSATSCRL